MPPNRVTKYTSFGESSERMSGFGSKTIICSHFSSFLVNFYKIPSLNFFIPITLFHKSDRCTTVLREILGPQANIALCASNALRDNCVEPLRSRMKTQVECGVGLSGKTQSEFNVLNAKGHLRSSTLQGQCTVKSA